MSKRRWDRRDTIRERSISPAKKNPPRSRLRRSAQLSMYWNKTFPSLHDVPGAGIIIADNPTRLLQRSAPVLCRVPVFASLPAENGISVVSVVNKSARAWTGELQSARSRAQRRQAHDERARGLGSGARRFVAARERATDCGTVVQGLQRIRQCATIWSTPPPNSR